MFIRKILTEETPRHFDINVIMEMITRAYEMELNDFKKGTIVTSLMISNLVMNNSDFLAYNTEDSYLGINEILINEYEGTIDLGRTKHSCLELSIPSSYENEGAIPLQDLYENGLDKYTMFTHYQINCIIININSPYNSPNKPLPNVRYYPSPFIKFVTIDMIADFKMRFSKIIKNI
jgi:hypothetical protein